MVENMKLTINPETTFKESTQKRISEVTQLIFSIPVIKLSRLGHGNFSFSHGMEPCSRQLVNALNIDSA